MQLLWKLILCLYETQLCAYYLHRMHVNFFNILWEPGLTLEEVQTWVVHSLCPLGKKKISSHRTTVKYSSITVPHILHPYIWELRFFLSLLGLEESVTYPIATHSQSPSVWQGYWLGDFLSTEQAEFLLFLSYILRPLREGTEFHLSFYPSLNALWRERIEYTLSHQVKEPMNE